MTNCKVHDINQFYIKKTPLKGVTIHLYDTGHGHVGQAAMFTPQGGHHHDTWKTNIPAEYVYTGKQHQQLKMHKTQEKYMHN